MQVFRIVRPGTVDKVIAFDELPADLLMGVETMDVKQSGMPRHWIQLAEKHYVLFVATVNKDKERWEQIVSYIRQNVIQTQRISDNIENMALFLAPDAHSQVNIEPEDVPVIKLIKQGAPVENSKAEAGQVLPVTQTGKIKHNCSNGGRGGRLAAEGTCRRCDQIRSERKVLTV